jgi:hypothetical protein
MMFLEIPQLVKGTKNFKKAVHEGPDEIALPEKETDTVVERC